MGFGITTTILIHLRFGFQEWFPCKYQVNCFLSKKTKLGLRFANADPWNTWSWTDFFFSSTLTWLVWCLTGCFGCSETPHLESCLVTCSMLQNWILWALRFQRAARLRDYRDTGKVQNVKAEIFTMGQLHTEDRGFLTSTQVYILYMLVCFEIRKTFTPYAYPSHLCAWT